MRIRDMFERDIDRNINGVIKISQTDEDIIQQELSEYVVTRELRGHFATFYNAYERALDTPTDKIGVWISGFFGSGKSHFLKMLSYLLSNRTVGGKSALDYIEPRFEDSMLAAKARRAASVPTETILFNIDSKGTAKDEMAVVRTFARVFYENQGFYGASLKLARLEALIEEQGKTEEFRAAYEQESGHPWVEWRRIYKSKSDPLIEALAASGVQSRDEAVRWCNADEQSEPLSSDILADEINAYVERRAAENGGQFRLLFMVDEIGQYVGGDTSLMLNLQTIVEDLGSKCSGRVWVIVTGQEAIDEITSVASNDFSKIQGRFNTRLSLSSSDASEVIKRRVLAKNENAAQLLQMSYGDNAAVLKNLFTFRDARADLTGYKDAPDFAQTFPFVNYQFSLLQNVMNELRKQGHSGKHLSSGERSMLSGFQEAAQAVEDKDEHALVPFWMFYDGTQTFLESYHRQVINRAARQTEENNGLEEYDVRVLKLLFLLRWVDREIVSNPDNIVTLMTDDIRVNRMELTERVQASLDRLMKQNYITRNGDRYQFLTDEEQEITNQIARTHVDVARVTAKASEIMFKDIYDAPKLTLSKNQFPITEYLDDTRVNNAAGLVLNVIACMDGRDAPTREQLISESMRDEAIVVLCPEVDYYNPLMEAARIEQFMNTVVRANLPQTKQDIIRAKQQEKTSLEKEARARMEQAVRCGEVYVQGNSLTISQTSSAKKIIEDALSRLVETTYQKLSYIDKNYDNDAEIKQILNGAAQTLPGQQPNARAIEEVDRKLKADSARHRTVNMSDIQRQFQAAPYGWRELDIAAVVAELLMSKRAKLIYAGNTVALNDAKCPNYLRMRSMVDKVQIEARVAISDAMRTSVREVIEELCHVYDLPLDEDGLAERARKLLQDRMNGLQSLLDVEYRRNSKYPGHGEVADAVQLIRQVLSVGNDSSDLLESIASNRDKLLDTAEDLEDIDDFFPDRQRVFDTAFKVAENMKRERDHLLGDPDVIAALDLIDEILGEARPYRRISELPNAVQTINTTYNRLLKDARADANIQVDEMFDDIKAYAEEQGVALSAIEQTRLTRHSYVNDTESLMALDALRVKLESDQRKLIDEIDTEHDRVTQSKLTSLHVDTTKGSAASGAPAGGNAAGGASPAPAAEKPAPLKVSIVSRSRVFKPRRLCTPQEIDAYLEHARAELMAALEGNDAVKLN